MRSVIGQLVAPLLVLLLAMSTPVATGDAFHQNELLHPVLPHVHMLNGQIVSDQQVAAARLAADAEAAEAQVTHGITLGAGIPADAAGLGIALGPTLPAFAAAFITLPSLELALADSIVPTEYLETPRDPPPDHVA
jgi:hypothetical protein